MYIITIYVYIFFYFQLFVVKWTDDEDIFFEPFTYLDTSSPGTFWACPGTFRACLRAPTKQHPKNLQKYHAIFEKKRNLTKNLPDIQNLTKKNNKQKIATAARADLFETDYNSSTIKLTANFTKKIFFREIEIFVYIIKTNNNNRLVRQNM